MPVCEESLTNKTSRYVIQHFMFFLFLVGGIRREARQVADRWRRSENAQRRAI